MHKNSLPRIDAGAVGGSSYYWRLWEPCRKTFVLLSLEERKGGFTARSLPPQCPSSPGYFILVILRCCIGRTAI